MKLLLPVCLLILTISCSDAGNKKQVVAWNMLPVPTDSTEHYFAADEGDSLPGAFNNMVNTWFSEMLLTLREPVLKNYTGDRSIFRFTWLRTRHHPVTVRVEQEGGDAMLFCKVTDGVGGYLPGEIIIDTAFVLNLQKVAAIRQKLQEAVFDTLSTHEPNLYKDGAEWIIEVYLNKKYQVVVRCSPQKNTALRAVGEYMMSLAPLAAETETEINY